MIRSGSKAGKEHLISESPNLAGRVSNTALFHSLLLMILWQSGASTSWGVPLGIAWVLGVCSVFRSAAFCLWALLLSGASYFSAYSALPTPESIDQVRRWEGEEVQLAELEGRVEGRALRNIRGEVRALVRGRVTRAGEEVKGLFLLRAPNVPWSPFSKIGDGSLVRVAVKPELFSHPVEPFSYEGYLRRRGVVFVGRAVEEGDGDERRESPLFSREVSFQDEPAYGVLLAGVLGYRDRLSSDLNDLFRETSTSHLIVVSGFHVGFLFLLSMRLARWFYSLSERLCIIFPAQQMGAILGVIASTAYVHLVGYDVTTLRALVGIVIYGVSKLLLRRVDHLRTLLLSGVAVVAFWPGCFFEAGFQLTFAALWGLMLAAHYEAPPTVRGRYILKPLAQSLGAFLCTSPILLLWFQTFVPLSPLVNLFAGPYFTAVCIVGGGIALTTVTCGLPLSEEALGIVLTMTEWFLQSLESFRWGTDSLGLGMWTLSNMTAQVFAWFLSASVAALSWWLYRRKGFNEGFSER